ncbi:hypothetical protein HUS23_04400 [Ectothiorhodospiraceae bacterium 2226]|nr:hypothetical protein HUS23_04400 [Ectothiorhodospiraceae bacterium 2226]
MGQATTLWHLLVLVLLVAWLSGCGFRLRGAVSLPAGMEATRVEAQGVSNELANHTRRALEAAGARITTEARAATARLRLLDERRDRRVLSVDSAGQVREYELVYALRFEVRDRAGKILVGEQTVELVRAVTFDPGEAALGRLGEQEVVQREMLEMAVNQMLQRIAAAGRSGGASAEPGATDDESGDSSGDSSGGADAPAP